MSIDTYEYRDKMAATIAACPTCRTRHEAADLRANYANATKLRAVAVEMGALLDRLEAATCAGLRADDLEVRLMVDEWRELKATRGIE